MSKHSRPESPLKTPSKRRIKNQDQLPLSQFFSTARPDLDVNQLVSPSGRPPATQTPAREVIDVDLLDFADGVTLSPPEPTKEFRQENTLTARTTSAMTISTNDEPMTYDDMTVDPATGFNQQKPWTSRSTPYSFLAHTLSTLTQTRSRIVISHVLTNCLRTIIIHDPDSLLPTIYLLSNTLKPPYSSVELGLGPSIISRSIQYISGLAAPALKRLYNTLGDAGDVAFAAKSNLRTLFPHPPLLVSFFYQSMLKIASCKGQGTSKEKQKIVEKLLLSATGEEVRFLVRTLSQNLRVGAVRASILSALAHAMVLIPPDQFIEGIRPSLYHVSASFFDELAYTPLINGKNTDPAREELSNRFTQAENLIKRIYVQHPNYDHIIPALLQAGLDGLEERVHLAIGCSPVSRAPNDVLTASLSLGIPLHPTLGSPTRSLDEVYHITQDRPFTAEFKYDGQRAQIHGSIEGGNVSVHLFSRHLEDMTTKYPDVVSLVEVLFKNHVAVSSFILDAEIVAIGPDGTPKSFQELSNRARKDVELEAVRVSVAVFVFDIMYLNEEVLLGRSFRERRALLRAKLPPLNLPDKQVARFYHVESCSSAEGRGAVEAFWQKAIQSRCEGLMIKLLDNGPPTEDDDQKISHSRRKQLPATYEPDKRTFSWLKLKKDYVSGLGDTLDLIPIGAWHGNGRKAQWWSPILLGVWEPESGRVVAVCKCMSGFSDVFYKGLAARYELSEASETCSRQPLGEYDVGGFAPDVYFKPTEVWEIRGADITQSPVSVAAKGLVSGARGLSIRFPRFLKVQNDKSIEQASTPSFLAKMWADQQATGTNQGKGDEGELVDIDSEELPEQSDEEGDLDL